MATDIESPDTDTVDAVDGTDSVDLEIEGESAVLDAEAAGKPAKREGGLGHRLYTGEAGFHFVAHRRRWYLISAALVLISIGAFIFRGLNFSIDFVGGNQFQVPASSSQQHQATDLVQSYLDKYTAAQRKAAVASGQKADSVRTGEIASAQVAGTGSDTSILITTTSVDEKTALQISDALAAKFKPNIVAALNARKVPVTQESINAQVSGGAINAAWGSDISQKAITALIVFLIAVSIFLRLRYRWRMVAGALTALLHDLVIAAGVYALVGFEVSPSTVIGLLTILGFSLYDTVVVFDKVDENTRHILSGSKMTYSEATNLAINQTLMRSINTTLISLLPVGGLLFVGAGLLGAGTLKDLSLVLFVGIAIGAYSSIFLAAPITVEFAERRPEYIELTRRVKARRAAGKGEAPTKPAKGSKNATEPREVMTTTIATKAAPTKATKPGTAKSGAAKSAAAKSGAAKSGAAKAAASKSAAAKAANKPKPGTRPTAARDRKS